MNSQPTGWIKDPVAVDAATVAMGADRVLFGSATETQPLKGYAQRQIAKGQTGVFPHLAEKQIFGEWLPCFHQRHGTCVSQGGTRAIQDAWFVDIVRRGVIGRVVELSVPYGYAGSRIQIGKGRIRGDGSLGGWFAQFVANYGVIERAVHGQHDLTLPREDLAVEWGRSGSRGVPRELLDIGSKVKVKAYRCTAEQDILDAALAGFGLAFCGSMTYGAKDKYGISRLNQPANHCTEAIGACLSEGGEPLIGGQQSWGIGRPSGTNKLKYKGGTVELRPGMCFVPLEDYWREVQRQGECWAFQVDSSQGFRPEVA